MNVKRPYWLAVFITLGMMLAGYAGMMLIRGVVLIRGEEGKLEGCIGICSVILMGLGAFGFAANLILLLVEGRRAFMRISRYIKLFTVFSLVALLGYGMICWDVPWDFILRRLLGLQGETGILAGLISLLVMLIAILGMVGSLVELLVAGVIANRRVKVSRQRDFRYGGKHVA